MSSLECQLIDYHWEVLYSYRSFPATVRHGQDGALVPMEPLASLISNQHLGKNIIPAGAGHSQLAVRVVICRTMCWQLRVAQGLVFKAST